MTQAQIKSSVDVGPKMGQVSTVRYWHDNGFFRNEGEARAAFWVAYQQALDGMGKNISSWMGLSESEYDGWIRSKAIPEPKQGYSNKMGAI